MKPIPIPAFLNDARCKELRHNKRFREEAVDYLLFEMGALSRWTNSLKRFNGSNGNNDIGEEVYDLSTEEKEFVEQFYAELYERDQNRMISELSRRYSEFIDRWGTPPFPPSFLDDEHPPDATMPGAEKPPEAETIAVYPWTTIEEVQEAFREIREKTPGIDINPEEERILAKIDYLRDLGYADPEISSLLDIGEEMFVRLEAGKNGREKELSLKGHFDGEIDGGLPVDSIDSDGDPIDSVRLEMISSLNNWKKRFVLSKIAA